MKQTTSGVLLTDNSADLHGPPSAVPEPRVGQSSLIFTTSRKEACIRIDSESFPKKPQRSAQPGCRIPGTGAKAIKKTSHSPSLGTSTNDCLRLTSG